MFVVFPEYTLESRGAPVAQQDRASASGAEGCGFNSRRAHQFFWGFRRERLSVFIVLPLRDVATGFFSRTNEVAFGHGPWYNFPRAWSRFRGTGF